MCVQLTLLCTSWCICRISVDGKSFDLYKKDHKLTIYKCSRQKDTLIETSACEVNPAKDIVLVVPTFKRPPAIAYMAMSECI